MTRPLGQRLARRLRALFRPRPLDADLDDELRFHLEMQVAELRRQGFSERQAYRRARLDFGSVDRVREECREARGVAFVEELLRDLRLAARTLRRRPVQALLQLSVLALAVGAATAMTTTTWAILVRPLPVAEPATLQTLWQTHPERSREEAAPANFLDWRQRATQFEGLAAIEPYGVEWQRTAGNVYLPTSLVSEGFFEVVGVTPTLGRTFALEEHQAGASSVALLGHRLWRQRFAGDERIVGREIVLDQTPHTVIGVLPADFPFAGGDSIWLPKVWQQWEAKQRVSTFYRVFGRLRRGATPAAAQAEMDVIAAELARQYPQANDGVGVAVVAAGEELVGGLRHTLPLLLAAVALVLGIAVCNLAGLELARAIGRRRELRLRRVLGAGRWRLTRLRLTESLLVGLLGTGLGLLLAQAMLAWFLRRAPASLPRLAEIRLGGGELVAATLLGLAIATAAGLASLGLGRARAGGRAQGALIAAQVCCSALLMVAALLLLRSLFALLGEERGFRSEGVAVVTVQSWDHYDEPHDRAAFAAAVVADLAAHPDIAAAGMSSSLPLMASIGAERRPLIVDDAPAAGGEPRLTRFSIVTPGFFDTLDIPLRRGRRFDRRDTAEAAPVVIVNDALARRLWPGSDPVGRRIRFAVRGPLVERTVIGVTASARHRALEEPAPPALFLPHAQEPTGANAFVAWSPTRSPAMTRQAMKRILHAHNPAIAIYNETALDELVGASVQERRFATFLVTAFAATTLLLAAVGIAALTAQTVLARRREIGVRMALGARRREVVGSMMRRVARYGGLGICAGLLGATALARLLEQTLHGVTPLDPLAFAIGGAGMLLMLLLATWLPARRAATVDPTVALHAD